MKRVLIFDTLEKIGEKVSLSGSVQTVRSHGKIAFFDLHDRTGLLQIGGFGKELADQIAALNPLDVVTVEGTVKKRDERYINAEMATGTIEVELEKLTVIAKADTMP
ncbi:MAG TPA: OB-fold nucleic acid binding domain-containing protein, partial [Candidatus Levybacteria bacterium]|nr:OB-fold nucleic acid binding domain-containing protein [Candidatus Levybacteria bacterium]